MCDMLVADSGEWVRICGLRLYVDGCRQSGCSSRLVGEDIWVANLFRWALIFWFQFRAGEQG